MADPNIVNIVSLTYPSTTKTLPASTVTCQVATLSTTQIIDSMMLSNLTTAVVTVTIAKMKSAGAAIDLLKAVTIQPNTALQLTGPINLEGGDKIVGLCSNANKVAYDSNYRLIS